MPDRQLPQIVRNSTYRPVQISGATTCYPIVTSPLIGKIGRQVGWMGSAQKVDTALGIVRGGGAAPHGEGTNGKIFALDAKLIAVAAPTTSVNTGGRRDGAEVYLQIEFG